MMYVFKVTFGTIVKEEKKSDFSAAKPAVLAVMLMMVCLYIRFQFFSFVVRNNKRLVIVCIGYNKSM